MNVGRSLGTLAAIGAKAFFGQKSGWPTLEEAKAAKQKVTEVRTYQIVTLSDLTQIVF